MKYIIFIWWLSIHSILSAGNFIERHIINCGDTIIIEGLGYPTWNPAKIFKHSEFGYDIIKGDNTNRQKLIYYAPVCINISDTVIVLCARATQITCDTGYFIFEVNCGGSGPIETSLNAMKCNDTLIVENLNGFQIPEIEMRPSHGQAKILIYPTDGAALWYVPSKNYEGPDYIKVKLISGTTWLYIVNVRCEETNSVNKVSTYKDITYQYRNELLIISSASRISKIQLYTLDGKELDYEIVGKGENQEVLKLTNGNSGLVVGIVKTEKGIRNLKVLILK